MKNIEEFKMVLYPTIVAIVLSVLFLLITGQPIINSKENQIENIKNDINRLEQTIQLTDKNYRLKYNSCDFQYTGEYKYIDIATNDNRIHTPANVQGDNYLKYTKEIQINGDIVESYLCIISDISDKKESYKDYAKEGAYYFLTYLYRGNLENAGFINVGCYKNNGSCMYYDFDSHNKKYVPPILDGKLFGHELPHRFLLDLSSMIVSDKENGGFKYISPINQLKNGKNIRVGGFLSKPNRDAYWASSISAYRIIYKGDGEIIQK